MDHPCSRGVYIKGDVPTNYFYGSSPLARGLLVSDPLGAVETRIIPARAGFTTCGCGGGCGGGDHPRSRGVYAQGAEHVVPVIGSSPLARGLPAHSHGIVSRTRIIPARAGFTFGVSVYELCSEDHPRSRGVYELALVAAEVYEGSSPLARGLLIRESDATSLDRIIPARAGFTRRRCGPGGPWRDHPRSRGVYFTGRTNMTRTYGSSPLARGLLLDDPLRGGHARIIPARAGFTWCTW